MKRAFFNILGFTFFLGLSLFLLAGCFSGQHDEGSGSGGGDGSEAAADDAGTGFLGGSPLTLIDQDFLYDFTPSSSEAGASFSITNKPAWAAFDSTTGRLWGYPTTATTHSDISIRAEADSGSDTIDAFSITVTGDPLSHNAWHLQNRGQTNYATNSGTSGDDINVMSVYRNGILGTGVKVAISDTGLQIAHEDLAANIIDGASKDYTVAAPYFGDPSPDPASTGGDHGTSVAGLVAAVGWNGLGSRGVAPGAGLAGFNFIPNSGNFLFWLDQAQGDYDIFNQSWGNGDLYSFSAINPTYRDMLKSGVTTLRSNKGALYVRSAGNDGYYHISSNYQGINSTPYVIVVGALNADGQRSIYSSWGSNLWVSAPGGEYGSTYPAMVTTDVMDCDHGYSKTGEVTNPFEDGDTLNSDCNYTSTFNGTSSAAPVTSGVIALILEANPALTWRDVKHILAETSTQVDSSIGDKALDETPICYQCNGYSDGKCTVSPLCTRSFATAPAGFLWERDWITNTAGYTFHNWYGFGRVNAQAAVDMAQSYSVDLGSLEDTTVGGDEDNWQHDSGVLVLAIPDNDGTGATDTIDVTNNLVIEAVMIQISMSHSTYVGQLAVELTSPSGTTVTILNAQSNLTEQTLSNAIVLVNGFYGENSLGDWTLRIIDPINDSETGSLTNWKINILGHSP